MIDRALNFHRRSYYLRQENTRRSAFVPPLPRSNGSRLNGSAMAERFRPDEFPFMRSDNRESGNEAPYNHRVSFNFISRRIDSNFALLPDRCAPLILRELVPL